LPDRGPGFEVAFVRHAKAGSRSEWQGDDRRRPLTSAGRKQANALVTSLRDTKVKRILSSPYARCLETVAPLGLDRGLEVEATEELAEGAGLAAFLQLVDRAGVDAVYCGHADLAVELLESLIGDGLIKPGEARLQKGSVWLLERRKGRFRGARYRAPA
jgi:8-oxo-dGTP diphosphatase